jgi:putative addiction module component (TIGR02574 family)
MPTSIEQIEAQAMQLSPQERAELADRLWMSVEFNEEIDAAWNAEIARRMAQLDSGEVQCIPWDQAMSELRAKLSP